MPSKELEKQFLEKISEYLVALPFDLKILQEAVSDPDLDRAVREMAAGTIIHTLLPQEGESPQRYIDDVFLVRAALRKVGAAGEGGKAFADRFAGEVYDHLESDVQLFESVIGDLWPWLEGKVGAFSRQALKGKKATQCLDDDEASSFLYEEGLEFQTNYPADEEQVRNKVRRVDAILDVLKKRHTEEAKKIS